MNKHEIKALRRLDALGFAPKEVESDEQRLAYGVLFESISRLDFAARHDIARVPASPDMAQSRMSILRERVEDIETSVNHLAWLLQVPPARLRVLGERSTRLRTIQAVSDRS